MKKLLILLAIFCLTGCAKQPQVSTLYQQGHSAYLKQNYHTAFHTLLAAAKQGDANSQYAIGYMLYNGIGTKRDQTTALIWLQRAAKQGQLRAIEALQRINLSWGKA